MLKRLAATCYRRRWRVLAAWVVALIGLTILGQAKGAPASQAFHLPSSDSQQAIEENFRGVAEATRRRILCDNARELYRL